MTPAHKELKELWCRDCGVDCDFTVRGENVQQIIEACAEHAIKEHGWKGFSEELFVLMRRNIRTITVSA